MGEVTRVYEGETTTPALPPLVRYKRELLGMGPRVAPGRNPSPVPRDTSA